MRIPHLENWAPEVHTFWPLTTHSSPSRSARAWSPARSEPAPGSENSWHQTSLPVTMFGRNRGHCSSVPWSMMVGPAIITPMPLGGPDGPDRGPSCVDLLGLVAAQAPAEPAFRPGRKPPATLGQPLPPVAEGNLGVPVLTEPRLGFLTHVGRGDHLVLRVGPPVSARRVGLGSGHNDRTWDYLCHMYWDALPERTRRVPR